MVCGTCCDAIVELARERLEIPDGGWVGVAVVERFDRIRVGVVHPVGRSCQALITPAFSFASTLSTLNDAGSWLGGNSASVWSICATYCWAGMSSQA